MEGVHYIVIIRDGFIMYIIHILRPGIRTHDYNGVIIISSDNWYDLICIGINIITAAVVPGSIGGLITDFVKHIVIVRIHFGVLCKKCFCRLFIFIGIVLVHMPVYYSVHSQILCIVHSIYNKTIQHVLSAVKIAVIISGITYQTDKVYAPFIPEGMESLLINKGRADIPLHAVGTGAAKLHCRALLIHDDRGIPVFFQITARGDHIVTDDPCAAVSDQHDGLHIHFSFCQIR